MKNWYFRSVFFVETVESSIDFYREKLGFSLNWKHEEGNQIHVCQLSRGGFELILAQDSLKASKSRVFISLDSQQEKEIRKDIADKVIQASDCNWGIPIIKILDLDGNELFFSPPEINSAEQFGIVQDVLCGRSNDTGSEYHHLNSYSLRPQQCRK